MSRILDFSSPYVVKSVFLFVKGFSAFPRAWFRDAEVKCKDVSRSPALETTVVRERSTNDVSPRRVGTLIFAGEGRGVDAVVDDVNFFNIEAKSVQDRVDPGLYRIKEIAFGRGVGEISSMTLLSESPRAWRFLMITSHPKAMRFRTTTLFHAPSGTRYSNFIPEVVVKADVLKEMCRNFVDVSSSEGELNYFFDVKSQISN